jgi:signal transduction histidine kinase
MILHQHQGRIWAESSSEGAKFSLVIPFRQHGSEAARLRFAEK